MKKQMIALVAAGFAISPAFAGDLEQYCIDYSTDNGGDPSGCSCLADTADASMTEELMAVSSEADIEALSDASKEAIAACWPNA